jgi:hypothetical protein
LIVAYFIIYILEYLNGMATVLIKLNHKPKGKKKSTYKHYNLRLEQRLNLFTKKSLKSFFFIFFKVFRKKIKKIKS